MYCDDADNDDDAGEADADDDDDGGDDVDDGDDDGADDDNDDDDDDGDDGFRYRLQNSFNVELFWDHFGTDVGPCWGPFWGRGANDVMLNEKITN